MNPETRQALEAILFVVEEPVDLTTLSQVLEVGRDDVETTLGELRDELDRDGRGFVLREVAGGWRLYTAPDAAPYVERFVLSGRTGRLTQAALETLAVIAYKQPISRHEISDIRGVNADGPVRTLVQRGLVEEVGRDEGPGQAVLYGTTAAFLEQLGLNALEDLPPLTDYLPDEPAPDEPRSTEDLAAARRSLAGGSDLPATADAAAEAEGAPEERPEGSEEPDQPATADAADATRREQEDEMAELTAALDRAAEAAVSQLRRAREATQDETAGRGDANEDDTGGAADASEDEVPSAADAPDDPA